MGETCKLFSLYGEVMQPLILTKNKSNYSKNKSILIKLMRSLLLRAQVIEEKSYLFYLIQEEVFWISIIFENGGWHKFLNN